MAWRRRYEDPEPQRVNRWLAQSGVCSRREAEALIASGRVEIDGERVDDPGRKITHGQTLELSDAAAAKLAGALSLVLHKPLGVVSGQPKPGQTPAVRLLTRAAAWGDAPMVPDRASRLAPVGRLDRDSRGLLLMSEDGVVAKAVIGPGSALEKEYLVRVRGEVAEAHLRRLRHGLELDGRRLWPAEVDRLADGALHFVLCEGRNRQIRRMCELIGLTVIDLLRVRIGPIVLGDLPAGRWRPLSAGERSSLRSGAADRNEGPPG